MSMKQYMAIGLAEILTFMPAAVKSADPADVSRICEYVEAKNPRTPGFVEPVEIRTVYFADLGIIANVVTGKGKKVVLLNYAKKSDEKSGNEPKYYGDGLDSVPGRVDLVKKVPSNLIEIVSAQPTEPSPHEQAEFDEMVAKLASRIAATQITGR